MTSTEAQRFTEAFYRVLERRPGRPPGPTAINIELGKPPPLNILNGRMSALRQELLKQSGFVKDDTAGIWGRWYRP